MSTVEQALFTSEDRFDLIAIQTLTGGVVGVIRRDIDVRLALAELAEAAAEDYGAGVIISLVPARDALHQLRQELASARIRHAPMHSAHEAYDELDGAVGRLRRKAGRQAIRAELIQIAAMAIRAVEDLNL